MEKYIDKTGMFEDFNFKLVVIDALLEHDPYFKDELESLVKKYKEDYEWYSGEGPIKEIVNYIAELKLDQKDLDNITELEFGGGSEIYFMLQPDFEGEEDIFDVTSIKGYEVLKNLKSVDYESMIDESLLEPMKEQGIEVIV